MAISTGDFLLDAIFGPLHIGIMRKYQNDHPASARCRLDMAFPDGFTHGRIM